MSDFMDRLLNSLYYDSPGTKYPFCWWCEQSSRDAFQGVNQIEFYEYDNARNAHKIHLSISKVHSHPTHTMLKIERLGMNTYFLSLPQDREQFLDLVELYMVKK